MAFASFCSALTSNSSTTVGTSLVDVVGATPSMITTTYTGGIQIGEIDTLVNNAGYMQPKYSYDNYPKEDRDRIMNVNLYAPVELMNLFSESMKKNKYGRIVNVGSIAGQIGHPDVWYGMSKAAIMNATKNKAPCK